jgi:RNA polymerase sigma-70 factor (ECF subfamily)
MRQARDSEAWHTFVDLYAPLVYRFGRKHGLQDADAADLTQDVLHLVAVALQDGKFDPALGSFRGWLYVVARNALYKLLRRRRRQPIGSGDTREQAMFQQIPVIEDEADWGREYRKRLFVWGCEAIRDEFRPTTWQAFWRTTVEEKSVERVAEELGMSAGAVYVARSRVLTRLKERVEEIDSDSGG